jgi:putative transposase
MAKATKTIKQKLCYKSAHSSYFATTETLFNQVAAFYFEVILAHPAILELSSKEALTALETLTHTTKANPHPVMPLACAIPTDIPATFRRAAIHAALGSARSFVTHLEKWRKQKEKAHARGKKFTIRPEVASASLAQISHPLCRAMERAHTSEHHAQALDRMLLGVDQMRYTRP